MGKVKITSGLNSGEITIEHPQPKPLSPYDLERLCEHIDVREEPSMMGGGGSISRDKTVLTKKYVNHYYCKLTNKLCVGANEIPYPPRGVVSPDIVARCPSRSDYPAF